MGQIVSTAHQEHVGVFYFFIIVLSCVFSAISQDARAVCIVSVASVVQFSGQHV